MSVTHKITRTYVGPTGLAISYTETVSANAGGEYSDTVAANQTNQHAVRAITQANLKSVLIYSDQAITLKTNSSSAPQETIVLAAGIPLIWSLAQDLIAKCPFAGNVTDLYWTTGAIPATANVQMMTVHTN